MTELRCCNVINLRLLTDAEHLSAAPECITLANGEIGLPTGSLCCPSRVASSLDAPPAMNSGKLMIIGLSTGKVEALVHSEQASST